MGKGTFFTGQPIFNQLLNFIPRSLVRAAARQHRADRYSKSFSTHAHLVTVLYAIFNQCTSLREVTTGLLAWDQRIRHLGLDHHPRRSTLSDANSRRSEAVFEAIYHQLLDRYRPLLPDSRRRSRKNNLYIFDSTSITLFQEILKGSGLSCSDGRRKGGIKVHTLLHAGRDLPELIRYSPAAEGDVTFLKEVHLAKGSVVVFDKGYCDYNSYNRFTQGGVTFVTRHRDRSVYQVREELPVNEYQKQRGVQCDQLVTLGYTYNKKGVQVPARLIGYIDPVSGKPYQFLTNNTKLSPLTIAGYYRQRWQIETFFKRIKQNYPLHYFLGDSENAIKIQIWCALIADLLLKVIRQGTRSRMAFSNITGLIRLHLMTYMDLATFLRSPEKALLRRIKERREAPGYPSLFGP